MDICNHYNRGGNTIAYLNIFNHFRIFVIGRSILLLSTLPKYLPTKWRGLSGHYNQVEMYLAIITAINIMSNFTDNTEITQIMADICQAIEDRGFATRHLGLFIARGYTHLSAIELLAKEHQLSVVLNRRPQFPLLIFRQLNVFPPSIWIPLRVDGNALCPICQCPYYDHPERSPTFHIACDGSVVKL